MNSWTERLLRKPTDLESAQILEEMAVLERLRLKTENLSSLQWEEGLTRLAPFRLKSSGTLKQGSVESWQKANIFVAQKIQSEANPTWDDILKINAMLMEVTQSEVRKEPVYLGPVEACPPELLTENLTLFQNQILNLNNHPDPLVAAALCQYWLVSLHPFADANGRTAVLLTDWILGSHGYLPMSFATKLDALVATLADGRVSATPGNAILKLIKNVQRSYQLILGE
ncbi:Fic family protein [Bdellovibrio sp. HCB-110]|uniref:Fic family protein n=1 Tax=Bdellovibrio sp. HCB-110 TaxID=3391182 RepID=UPI0039B6BE32